MDDDVLAAAVIEVTIVVNILQVRFVRKGRRRVQNWFLYERQVGLDLLVGWLVFQGVIGAPALLAFGLAGWLGLGAVVVVSLGLIYWLCLLGEKGSRDEADVEPP
jgi:hypothetical protein